MRIIRHQTCVPKRIFVKTTRINIVNRVIRAVRIQVKPVAPVGILLSKPSNDRVVEPCPQVILLGDGVDLLTIVGKAVEDGLLLDLNFSPGVVGIAVLDIAVFIYDVGG